MKKIYTITLDDEVPLSDIVSSDIKEIAYCLFEEMDKYDRPILVVGDNNNLVRNELLESFNGKRYNYRFESESSKIDNYRYEPFLINSRSFGFTVYDEATTDEEIMTFLNNVQHMLGFNYKFNIDSVYYDDVFVNGRLSAYNFLVYGTTDINSSKNVKVKKKVKSLINPVLSMFNI